MSASCRSSLKLPVAGLCCLLTTVALAQQGQSGTQRDSSQSGANAQNSALSGQSGRSSEAQSGRSTSQQGSAAQSGQRHTANYGASQGASAGGESQEVDRFFATCLLADNQGEVELSQLAEQKAHNPQVKEFAQMMVRDHQKMIQQLEQIAGTQSGASQGTSSGSASRTSGAASGGKSSNSATGGQSTANSGNAETTTGIPGSSGAGQTTSRNATSATSGTEGTPLTAGASSGSGAVEQIAQMDRQIVERKGQMAKEELQQKSGADFDKCYMGSLIPAHMHALAALEVIGQSQGQLAQVAKQSQPTVQEHLEKAKQIVKQLDGQSGSSTAERSSSSTER